MVAVVVVGRAVVDGVVEVVEAVDVVEGGGRVVVDVVLVGDGEATDGVLSGPEPAHAVIPPAAAAASRPWRNRRRSTSGCAARGCGDDTRERWFPRSAT